MIWYVHIIISVITTVILTFRIKKFLKKKDPVLFSYMVTTIGKMTDPNPPQDGIKSILVNTHTIIIKNPYSNAVKNVRVQNTMPQVLVNRGFKSIKQIITTYPLSDYTIKKIENSNSEEVITEEIIFEQLVPGESIVITYMYETGITFHQFNIFVKSNDGYAKAVQYAPQVFYPKWLTILWWSLIAIGSVTCVNIILTVINVFMHLMHCNLNFTDAICQNFAISLG